MICISDNIYLQHNNNIDWQHSSKHDYMAMHRLLLTFTVAENFLYFFSAYSAGAGRH